MPRFEINFLDDYADNCLLDEIRVIPAKAGIQFFCLNQSKQTTFCFPFPADL